MFLKIRLSEGLFLSQSIGDNIIISEIDKLTKFFGVMDDKKKQSEISRWVKELAVASPNPS